MLHHYLDQAIINYLEELQVQRNLLFMGNDGNVTLDKDNVDFLDYYLATGIALIVNRDKYLSIYHHQPIVQENISNLNKYIVQDDNRYTVNDIGVKLQITRMGYKFITRSLSEFGIRNLDETIIIDNVSVLVSHQRNLEICNFLLLTSAKLARFHAHLLSEKYPENDEIRLIMSKINNKQIWENDKFSLAMQIYSLKKMIF